MQLAIAIGMGLELSKSKTQKSQCRPPFFLSLLCLPTASHHYYLPTYLGTLSQVSARLLLPIPIGIVPVKCISTYLWVFYLD